MGLLIASQAVTGSRSEPPMPKLTTFLTARLSVMLLFSPPNIASTRSRSRDSSASRTRRASVSSVTRFFEQSREGPAPSAVRLVPRAGSSA